MGMKFHVKTASDVLSKGLDPRYPYKDLGHDGMLKVPTTPVVPAAPAVVSVSTVPVELPPPPPPAVVSEPVKEPEVAVASLPEEPAQEVSAPVVEKPEEKAPESVEDKKSVVKAPKAKKQTQAQ